MTQNITYHRTHTIYLKSVFNIIKSMGEKKIIFVTVGTTSFDKLIETVTSKDTCLILKQLGCTLLRLQIGRGVYEPSEDRVEGVRIEYYRYKEDISEDFHTADLVISHAGAGSCMEALGAKKPLIVVVNEELMGNHQIELAAKLHKEGHLLYGTCSELDQKLRTVEKANLKLWEAGRPDRVSSFLDKVMGVS